MSVPRWLQKQLGAGVCFSLPDLVCLATGWALANPEVSGVRSTWILISKKQSALKGRAPQLQQGSFLASQMSPVEIVTSQSWALPRAHVAPEVSARPPPLVFSGVGGAVFLTGVF